jgi:hypothetical protein
MTDQQGEPLAISTTKTDGRSHSRAHVTFFWRGDPGTFFWRGNPGETAPQIPAQFKSAVEPPAGDIETNSPSRIRRVG